MLLTAWRTNAYSWVRHLFGGSFCFPQHYNYLFNTTQKRIFPVEYMDVSVTPFCMAESRESVVSLNR